MALAALVPKPRGVAQWALAAGLLVLAAEAVFTGLTFASTDAARTLTYQTWALFAMAAIPGPWIFFSLTYSRGNWRQFAHRWRFLIFGAFAVPLALVAFFGENCVLGLKSTELAEDWFLQLAWPGSAVVLTVLLSSVLVLVNLERTFRASVGTLRWRIKYMVLGLGLLFGVQVYTTSQMLLFSGDMPSLALIKAVALLFACGLMALGAWRAGIGQVDVYPSQTLLQHSVTFAIAGAYLLVVGVLAKVIASVAGPQAFVLNAAVILAALVGLAVLVLSERFRERVKRFVSRHFKRPHYDYRQVWSTFTARIASLVDAGQVCRASADWLSENFRVLSVSLWLVDEGKNQLALGASTNISENAPHGDAASLILAMRTQAAPFNVDTTREPWVEALKQLHPAAFRAGGERICAPIAAGGELLGFIILGDRVNGVPFTVEEIDLLKCVADQLAGTLLNIRLSQRLLAAREMEAFQTMSAFFVHDLKNTASTLSLMLKNLPAHFDDPDFRKDALRGLGKSVERINELIGRLTLLRQEMHLTPKEVDLNELVASAVNAINGVPNISVQRALAPALPKLRVDPDKIQKVVANLLANAMEAVGEKGEICVSTAANNAWAIVAVTDNGCGMSAEYIDRNLFRPFQTTKKKGIGVGLFLSKIVVQGHRGKIEVDSEPGKGTTFRLLLPIEKP